MKKTKKALASLAIAGMVLSMAPASIFAADADTRLAGGDRYQTSIKIAEKAYASATTAVIAAGNPENLVDALAAAPLAAQEDAPIYLTDKRDMNNDVVKSLEKLGVKEVIVVGAAASQAVVDELKAAGFTVDAVKGAGRVETANAINAKLTAPAGNIVVGYNGVADAMSVASYAAANNYAIVVADRNGSVAAGTKADFIIGGPTLVKDIAGAERLFGADRFETNKKVIAELDFDFGKVYVGNGLTLADALVGSVLAAQTNSPIALTDGKTVKADIASNLSSDSAVVALGGTGVVSNAVIDAVKKSPSTGEFKVESVTATAASAFTVKFSKAPADTSKVTFKVQNAGTDLTTTATWNEAKTEAVLAFSANFPQGNYTVTVMDGEKELSKTDLTIEQQKVAKIEITSDILSVDPTANNGLGKGYATYKVYDQYGVEVTYLPLANNITWTPGIGSLNSAKDGVITIDPGASNIPLLTYSNAVINAYDTTSFVTASATIKVSQASGTISKLSLNKLSSPTNDDFNTSNTTGKWYVDYAALDASGNATTNYELMSAGILQVNGGPYLTTAIERDPQDSKKAAISVQLNQAYVGQLVSDMQIPITVILKNGTTATLNTTLKLGSRLETFTLQAPTKTVASGETVTIPFVAYDQSGKQITKASKLTGVQFSLSGQANPTLTTNPDGTASLVVTVPSVPTGANSLTVYMMATVTATGKTSQLNLTVQKTAEPTTLSLKSDKFIQAMQVGASQSVDFGYTYGGLSVKDQYGRDYNMDSQNGLTYKVVASTTGSAVTLTGTDIYGAAFSKVSAAQVGTQVVTFNLVDVVNNKVLDTKTQTLTVVGNDKIVGYTLNSLGTLYANATGTTALDKEYSGTLKVYGQLSNGSKVVLAPTVNTGTAQVPNVKDTVLSSSSNSGFFTPVAKASTGNYVDGTDTRVYANAISTATYPGKTTAEGKITVLVNGTDGRIHTLVADVASKTEKPVAESINYYIDKTKGVTETNDVITVARALVSGLSLSEFNGTASTTSAVYFFAEDQYGTEGAPVTVHIASQNLTAGTATIGAGNVLNLNGATSGTITLTAVTQNGLAKTITLNIQ